MQSLQRFCSPYIAFVACKKEQIHPGSYQEKRAGSLITEIKTIGEDGKYAQLNTIKGNIPLALDRTKCAKLAIADGFGILSTIEYVGVPIIGPYIPLWGGIAASWAASESVAAPTGTFGNSDDMVSNIDAGLNVYNNFGILHNEAIRKFTTDYTTPYISGTNTINSEFESDAKAFNTNEFSYSGDAFIDPFLNTYDEYSSVSYATYTGLYEKLASSDASESEKEIADIVARYLLDNDLSIGGFVAYINDIEAAINTSDELTASEKENTLKYLAVLKYSYCLWLGV